MIQMFGQATNWPLVGRDMHGPLPPAHACMPFAVRPAPIHSNTMPLTSLGKMRMRMRGFTRLSRTWNSMVTAMVPRKRPYAAGHGSFRPSLPVRHLPDAYCCAK